MKPGPDYIIACPHCEYHARIRTLTSGSTIGGRRWTDGKCEFPYLPESVPITRCKRCRNFFWLKDAAEVGEAKVNTLAISMVVFIVVVLSVIGVLHMHWLFLCLAVVTFWSLFRKWKSVRILSEPELLRAIRKKSWKNREEELILRRLAWWKANDRVRYKKRKSESTYETTSLLHSEAMENLKTFFRLLDPSLPNERLLKAEIARELGEFEEAQKWANMDFSCEYEEIALIIKKGIQQRNPLVQEVPIRDFKFKNLIIRKNEGIGWITINRPDKLNVMNFETMGELKLALANFANDSEVQAIILTGAGEKAFIAGIDISEFLHLGKEYIQGGLELMRSIENSCKPVVAAINGYALGVGIEAALACHGRVASESAILGLQEEMDLIPRFGENDRLYRLVRGKAWELIEGTIPAGQLMRAKEACAIGLVNKIVSAQDILPEAEAMAKEMIELSRQGDSTPAWTWSAMKHETKVDGPPLRRLFLEDEEKYRQAVQEAGARLGPDAGREIWNQPPVSGCIHAVVRWIQIDVLEQRGHLTPGQVAVLRAEALFAYAEAELDPKGAIWAKKFAESISQKTTEECRRRASEVVTRLLAATSKSK